MQTAEKGSAYSVLYETRLFKKPNVNTTVTNPVCQLVSPPHFGNLLNCNPYPQVTAVELAIISNDVDDLRCCGWVRGIYVHVAFSLCQIGALNVSLSVEHRFVSYSP